MEEPAKVVHAVLRKSLWPSKIVPVGWKAKGFSFFANVFPRFSEWLARNISHKIEIVPEARDAKGSLYQPIFEGRGIDEGVDERRKSCLQQHQFF